jgi:hypothetical protein
LPADFHGNRNPLPEQQKKLLLAMLVDTIMSPTAELPPSLSREYKSHRDALEETVQWIRTRGASPATPGEPPDYRLSFDDVCEHLRIPPEPLRKTLLSARRDESARQALRASILHFNRESPTL